MRPRWREDRRRAPVVAPLSLVVIGLRAGRRRAAHADAGARLEPDSALLLVDLGGGRDRLGGSCLAQVFGRIGDAPPDLDDPRRLAGFFAAVRELARRGTRARVSRPLRRRHRDHAARDGVCGPCRLDVDLGQPVTRSVAALFSEELGRRPAGARVRRPPALEVIARATASRPCRGASAACRAGRRVRIRGGRPPLHRRRPRDAARHLVGNELAHAAAARRPGLRRRGTGARLDEDRPGPRLAAQLRPATRTSRRRYIARGARPRVAVLREQGVNSQVEMAAAFDRAGFAPVDVHMTDVIDRGGTLDGLPGAGRLRRIQLRRRARRGRGLGEVDPVQCASARAVRGLVRAGGPIHARRLQWLPDARGARRADPGHGALAALPPQSLGAVRRPAVAGRDRGDRTRRSSRAWRAPCCRSRVAHGEGRAEFASAADAGGRGRRWWRCATWTIRPARRDALSGEPERLAATALPDSLRQMAESRS